MEKMTVKLDVNIKPLMAKLGEIKDAVEDLKADATPEDSEIGSAYGLCDAKPFEGTSIGTPKQPHVRIEFDDINDVPHVWIDGVRVDELSDYGLTQLDLHWLTDDDRPRAKSYSLSYLDNGNQQTISERTPGA